ncbi:mfb-1 [Pristionchus pacificus]|uniref:F-box domain-containing protein n=1 Tax=Pristionchus pacificus TaxID=54126 RepID=A0A8R1Z6J4_PRIPA|nr:mfb-1 [Pristionchus pacificus]
MSEAFHRLDLARAVSDIRRFSYVCKVVSILVEEKVRNLSATARKSLLSIITAIVIRASEEDLDVSTTRRLLNAFNDGLEGHLYGSPQLTVKHQMRVGSLLDAVSSVHPQPLDEIDNNGITFLDLPRELISLVMNRLSDSDSLIQVSKSHIIFGNLINSEMTTWKKLVLFHFSLPQIEMARKKKDSMSWRETFFYLRKMHGLREVYADVIHICCHCKALFWSTIGHPCIRPSSPSVRVTPRQFVDMLLFL